MTTHTSACTTDREIIPLAPWEQVLVDLLAIRSHTGEEREVALALERYLRSYFPEAQLTRQPIDDNRWNIILSKGTPRVTLSTHIDTVPGGPAPSATSDRIFGRGACDAKGQLIAQLWGLSMAIDRGLQSYRCAYVVGEETDAIGARTLVELPTTPYILNGEPTKNRFISRSWGAIDLEIETTGRSAHSSLGTEHSAIHTLVAELSNLLRDQPDGISINVGQIRGGIASNVQAPSASCTACARVRGTRADLENFLAQRLSKAKWTMSDGATFGIELHVPASARGSDVEVRFASDCSVYTRRYERVMLFGPGDIEEAHTENESIGRAELRAAAKTICGLLEELEAAS